VQVVLAQAIIREGLATAMEFEAVQLNREEPVGSLELVVYPVSSAIHLYLLLGDDACDDCWLGRRRQYPPQKGIFQK
jgi:hypothetical protein